MYLDPPYYVKGAGLYEHHYDHPDHERVAKVVTGSIKQNWVVSYDNVPQIRRIYRGRRHIQYGLSYSAQDRYEGTEVMYFDKRLVVPKTEIHP